MLKIENTEVFGWNADIREYPGYKISKDGVVTNKNGKIMKGSVTRRGYVTVTLFKKQKHKHCLVHRLVAKAFIPNPNSLPQVNHIDGNKQNNSVDNLEWCTCLYNLNYSGVIQKGNAAHRKPVNCITTQETFNSVKEACDKYGLSYSNVVACCNGRRSKTGGKQWKYAT